MENTPHQKGRKKTGDKKSALYLSAKELFSARGFKDTSVPEITRKAGIAAGTFYLYYPSKESLFMEIFLDENVKLKKSILTSVDPDGEPFSIIQILMRRNLEGITANPILREWYNRDVFAKIERKYSDENGLQHVDFMYDAFLQIVKKWQAEGRLRDDIDSDMIMAMFGAVIVIDEHKAEIGLQFFPKIQEYLTQFIMAGLQNHPAGGEELRNHAG
ncbi:MAG: TetR/AcrR family transcriptional regulator [Leptolinea sp.]|jgi:AcrR family transcriptional regulator|nr:TetR/AcrR family transcriptional regulator [Leptolinea sp.]